MVKLRALPPNSIISNGDGMLESRIDQPGFIAWKFDPNNTRSWNRIKKWKATITACYMSSLISVAASAYSQAMDGIQADLHSSHLLTVSGISFFTFAVAIFPTILAPLGEQFGRRPVYVITFALFFLSFIPNALAQNIQTVLISRFICGAMGSAGSTMVGGTLSDIWEPEERQVPMALFALSALLGTPMGLIGFSWAGGLTSWRWIFWVMLILAAPSFLVILLFFRQESLTREMREKIRQLQMSAEADQNSSFGRNSKRMLKPLFFLATEPITLMLSLWIAFAWGTLYLFLESVPMVFAPYGFTHDNKSRGLSFAGIGIGALIGFALHILILRTRKPVTKPEQRLFEACIGAIVFPVGFFFFAWTAKPDKIHWILPQIGTSVIMIGLFLVYICVFDYFADCYGSYTSSATAAQSLLRNILATALPLIADKMYHTLTFPWASSLLGFCALVLASAPYLLLWKGKMLRERSLFASNQLGCL